MKIYRLFPIILVMAILSGCGKESEEIIITPKSDTASSKPEQTKEVPDIKSEPTVDDIAEPESLSADELNRFTELFKTTEYHGFLIEPFNNSDGINWNKVLETGAGINVTNISDDEINDFLAATKRKRIYEYSELVVIRKSDLADFIETHTGLNIVPDKTTLNWDYIKEYDSYYSVHWSSEEQTYTCISGEKTGDSYALRFQKDGDSHFGQNADRVLTLTEEGDDLILSSNVFQWDDSCDEAQTFDTELKKDGGPVRFITYPAQADKGITALLIKDGKLVSDLYTSVSREDGYGHLKSISAVGFFDFNADGIKDIVIIGDSDFGETILLNESIDDDYSYEACYGVDEKIEQELEKDFTISRVKSVLLGDNTEGIFEGYKDAYAQIAKLYHMSSEDYKFDLIYADDDEIPELVINKPGYQTSLYTFENGRVHCLMYGWGYGAMGNTGYSYVPGKGIYFNHNNDYAGAVQYETYMSKREGKQIQADYGTEYIMFKDTNGDGEPSEDELAISEELEAFETIYFNYTDKEMSDDEIKAQLDLYNTYDYSELYGDKDYDTILSMLKK